MVQKKLKVLRIIARLNVGGPAIHTILLTSELNGTRFDSLLVTGQVGIGEKDMSYLAREKEIRPILIPELCRQINPVKDLIAFCKIFGIIRRERPDIVHTHTAKAGTLGRIAATFAGVPIKMHTFHGHIFENYFNGFYRGLFLFIERWLARFTDYIIVVSDAQKEEISCRYNITKPDKIKVIQLGLELEDFLSVESRSDKIRKEFAIGADTILVGIVGRLVPIKNHKMFLEAAGRLRTLAGGAKIKYLVIGGGEERDALIDRARELGLENEVVFCGWRQDMPQVYSEIDIVALTSLNEGTPVSIIEALAAKRAVVATDVGGVRDVVRHGVNGYLVASGDAEGFARRLAELVRDERKRADFGTRGRDDVREKYSKERLVKDISDLYEAAVSKNQATLCTV